MRKRIVRSLWIAMFLFILLFTTISCEQAYRALGFTDEQAKELADRDRGYGKQAVEDSQDTFWQWVSAAIAGVGALVSGLLAKWLGREQTTVRAIVTGVENGTGKDVKKSIAAIARAMGVDKHLSKVVKKLTGE